MFKKGMRHRMKPGYLRYFFSLLENCKQTSDWFRLFRLLRRLRKGVTNKECCGTMSLYGIWLVSFARGDTQSTALSVFFSSFFFSPCLVPWSAALVSFISPLKQRQCSKPQHPATERVSGSTVVARSPFYTAVATRLSGRKQGGLGASWISPWIRAERRC